MLKVGDRLGYISKDLEMDENLNEKEYYEYRESKVQSIHIGKKETIVKAKGFYGLHLEDIKSNTDIMNEDVLILIQEVFVTNDELAKKCKNACKYWNEHGAKFIKEK